MSHDRIELGEYKFGNYLNVYSRRENNRKKEKINNEKYAKYEKLALLHVSINAIIIYIEGKMFK